MKEHSRYPFRSARLSSPQAATLANNRLTLDLGRGTYRLQCVVDSQVAVNGIGVYYAIVRDDAITWFPVGTTETNARGEFLPVSGYHQGAIFFDSGSHAVEVDVLDNQLIVFWSLIGSERIKYVKVGELPTEDPELEGRRRE